jgi:hypothetical protein
MLVLKDERIVLRGEILVLREEKLEGKVGIRVGNSCLHMPPLIPP